MARWFAALRALGLVWFVGTQAGCAPALREPIFERAVAGAEGIEIVRGGAQVKVRAGMGLEVGDQLHTNSVSRALIKFPDGSRVIVEPNSTVSISSFRAWLGTILTDAKGEFRVQTQFVTVAVKGTTYRLSVDENQGTSVDVAEGTTVLTSNVGAWEAVDVRAREQALVRGQGVPQKRALSPEEVSRILGQFRTFNTLFDTFLQEPTRLPGFPP